MTDKLLTILKICVVILFFIAIVMGGWLVYKRFFQSDEVKDEKKTVTLTWWVLWEEEEDIRVLAEAYMKKNPNVNIVIEEQKLENNYRDKLITQISDNLKDTGPDIMRIHNTWLPMIQSYLSPLPSTIMTEVDYSNTFYKTALIDLKGSDGKIYAIPLMFDGLGLYYNKDLLASKGFSYPADTWDEFLEQARALTEYDEQGKITIAGAAMGGDDKTVQFSFEIVSLLMLQSGSSMTNQAGKSTFGNDSNAAKAFKYYTDYVTRYKIWNRTLDRDVQMFAEGRLAFMFAPSWRAQNILDALKTKDATLNFDIAPVPQQPSETGEKVYLADYWAEAVSRECEDPEVAWDFLKFITEKEQLRSFYSKCKEKREFGEIYPRKDMASELQGEKYVSAYVIMAESARTWRMVDKKLVSEKFNDTIKDILNSGITSEGDILNRLGNLATEVDQIMSQRSKL